MSTQNCLIFTRYYFIYIYLIPTINHKTRRYCLSSALNSNVKPPQDGGPRLGKHFWRGTWRCWHTGTTPRGRRVSFGSDSELLSARSQLPHRWLPLPRLAQGQFVSPPPATGIPQEAKHPNFLVESVSDNALAHVIDPAPSNAVDGAVRCK